MKFTDDTELSLLSHPLFTTIPLSFAMVYPPFVP